MNKSYVLCILLFLACTPTSPLTNLEQLEKLYQSNRFEQVLDLYAKKEKELKDNPSALNLIGKLIVVYIITNSHSNILIELLN